MLDTAVDVSGGYTGNHSVRQSSPRENTQTMPAAAFRGCTDFDLDDVLESSVNRLLSYEGTPHYPAPGNTDNVGSSSVGDVLMNPFSYDSNI